MNREKQKIKGIVFELVGFLLNHGAKDIELHVSNGISYIEIKVSGDVQDISKQELNDLREALGVARMVEIGEYYNTLVGQDGEQGEGLYILGTMVDRAEVNYKKDNNLNILVYRVEYESR